MPGGFLLPWSQHTCDPSSSTFFHLRPSSPKSNVPYVDRVAASARGSVMFRFMANRSREAGDPSRGAKILAFAPATAQTGNLFRGSCAAGEGPHIFCATGSPPLSYPSHEQCHHVDEPSAPFKAWLGFLGLSPTSIDAVSRRVGMVASVPLHDTHRECAISALFDQVQNEVSRTGCV